MFATLQLYLALGFGRAAFLADLALTGVGAAAVGIVVARARRSQAPVRAESDVVAEAEAVVTGAGDHQPV